MWARWTPCSNTRRRKSWKSDAAKIHRACMGGPKHDLSLGIGAVLPGEVSEWLKELAWKAGIRVDPVSRVRIPPSPHANPAHERSERGFSFLPGASLLEDGRKEKPRPGAAGSGVGVQASPFWLTEAEGRGNPKERMRVQRASNGLTEPAGRRNLSYLPRDTHTGILRAN